MKRSDLAQIDLPIFDAINAVSGMGWHEKSLIVDLVMFDLIDDDEPNEPLRARVDAVFHACFSTTKGPNS
jgi:hypothetical protein